MERSPADSFTAYLEARQRSKSSAQRASSGTAFTLLLKLAEAPSQQMPVAGLMTASGMSFEDFAEALRSLGDSGYLTLTGPPGNEVAVLTSLFTVHAGDRDIAIGPSSFLQIFREACDHAVDRLRASARGERVTKIMQGISYAKAYEGLPPYCPALMQNLPDEEQVRLMNSPELLNQEEMDEAIKVRILGLQLMNVVGPAVLTAAVESLRDELKSNASGT